MSFFWDGRGGGVSENNKIKSQYGCNKNIQLGFIRSTSWLGWGVMKGEVQSVFVRVRCVFLCVKGGGSERDRRVFCLGSSPFPHLFCFL